MKEKTLIGYCGVDSGQILLVDPCYVEDGLNYDRVCDVAQGDNVNKESARGVVTCTRYGDGVFPVIATGDPQSPDSVTILFTKNPEFKGTPELDESWTKE